ncbi:hypothetical protein [Fibrobacter succinogenes]|uniref:hypothetical protein n=1 Tax=Fibrobacter succinogenes TaxID=833 RepID=UPI00156A275D|nr:hypothetical protein [Fibrobacter succinogenes]
MRRLLYSDFETTAKKYRDNIFKNLKQKPKDNLDALKSKITATQSNGYQKYIDYIDEIINNFEDENNPEDILLAKPSEVKKSWDNYKKTKSFCPNDYFYKHRALFLTKADLEESPWNDPKDMTQFNDAIVDALRYDYVRNSPNGFVSYFDDLKINACVYCNASYIVNTNVQCLTTKGKTCLDDMGRYELDHYLPKSEYPFLCVSFYNLQPSCPFCNRWKSIKDSEFYLYTDDSNDLDPFKFDFDKKVITSLSVDKSKMARNIHLNSQNTQLKINHNNVFHIDDLYKAFDDVLEELLWYKNAQTKGYLKNIKATYRKFLSNDQIVRLLYRFYANEDIHKRPLSKMRLDLAKKLKLY